MSEIDFHIKFESFAIGILILSPTIDADKGSRQLNLIRSIGEDKPI